MILATWPSAARADDVASLFREANSRYESGDYDGSLDLYEKVIAAGFESGAFWYNIGNAYYKLGDTGRAVLAFERAKKLMPRDEDVRFNLALANLQVKDRIPIPPEWFVSRWRRAAREIISGDAVVKVLMGIYTLGVLLVISYLFVRREKWRKVIVWTGAAAGAGFAVVGLLAIEIVTQEVLANEAVVLAREVAVQSAPQNVGTELFLLHAGTKVELRERQDDWVQLRLADGKVGWTPASALEEI